MPFLRTRDPHQLPPDVVRALRPVRVTWGVLLASQLAFFALPAWIDALFRALERDPRRPVYFEVAQYLPGEIRRGASVYVLWAVCGICLALAALVPARLHARAVEGVEVQGDERMVVPGAYRAPPERRLVLTARTLARLQAAYHARLGTTLLLLWPALLLAGFFGVWPLRWFTTIQGCGLVFAGVFEYLPLLVAALGVLLIHAPTPRRVVGSVADGIGRGAVVGPET